MTLENYRFQKGTANSDNKGLAALLSYRDRNTVQKTNIIKQICSKSNDPESGIADYQAEICIAKP